jgi:hypothetical protein
MPRQDLTKDERAFDAWFAKQPAAVQRRYRKAGVKPYGEMPVPDNVFAVKETHPAFGSYFDDDAEVTITQRFIAEGELRPRLCKVFDVLSRYADERTASYLLFVRTLLGEQTGVTVGNMAKQFGVTRQCMNHRARTILAALDELSGDPGKNQLPPKPGNVGMPATPSWYRARATRDEHDDCL